MIARQKLDIILCFLFVQVQLRCKRELKSVLVHCLRSGFLCACFGCKINLVFTQRASGDLRSLVSYCILNGLKAFELMRL